MDRYFFDKRVIKKSVLKYAIMFLIALPILLVMNMFVLNKLSFWAATFIDVAILFAVVLICTIVLSSIEKKKEEKRQAQIEKEKELERARRRAKKSAKKATNSTPKVKKEVSDVEIITPDSEDK